MAWGKLVALIAVGALGCVAACSSTSGGPGGKVVDPPDHLFVDVDASTLPEQPDGDLGPDSPFAPVDGSAAYGDSYDAYAVLTVCPPSDGGVEGGADGEAPAGERDGAAYPADGGVAAQGCQPLPADCVSQPNCDCLLRVLAAETPCTYAHCSVGTDKGFSLYCP